MEQSFYQNFKLGILGGGQLGRMLIQAGIDLNINFAILDPDDESPCRHLAEFTQGKLTDHQTVMDFGMSCDLITIEIENVNVAALKELVKQGKKVYPQPEIIELIQDKRRQKEFYSNQGIPTAEFILVNDREEVALNRSFLPAVHKLGKEGYDGRGVNILKTERDISNTFNAPGLLEKLIDFDKEISVIVARTSKGEISTFPPVEMIFHPEANLVEYLFSPAQIDDKIAASAAAIAKKVITDLGMIGLLAVEMFITKDGQVLVNEVAPRPHNSGHQTIEGNNTSQYHQHLRSILGMPLGDTSIVRSSAMINLLGAEGFTGLARYEGLDKVLRIPGAHVHLYGKKITKPYRKMGHVSVVDDDLESLKSKARFIKENLKVIS